jgi:hypothetical protein
MIADLALPSQCFLVENVPQDKYDASEWPEILERLRQTYLGGGNGPSSQASKMKATDVASDFSFSFDLSEGTDRAS